MLLQLICQWVRESIGWATGFFHSMNMRGVSDTARCSESTFNQNVPGQKPLLSGPGLRGEQPKEPSLTMSWGPDKSPPSLSFPSPLDPHNLLRGLCNAVHTLLVYVKACLLWWSLCRTCTRYCPGFASTQDVLPMTELHRVTLISCVRHGITVRVKMPRRQFVPQ